MNLSSSIEKVARKSMSQSGRKECAQFKLCEIVDFKIFAAYVKPKLALVAYG